MIESYSMKKSIDILFINPGNKVKVYQNLSAEFTAVDVPVWATLLANYIRNKGYATAIYDVNVEGWNEEVAKEVVLKYSPDLIVIMVYGLHPSASTQTMPSALGIAADIKRYIKAIPIVLGGTHPSALPEKTIKEENVDFVIQGEGVYTIEGLIKYIKGKGNIKNIKGLWYKKDGNIVYNSQCQLIKDLDRELDNYALDLLPELYNYRAHNWHCFQYIEKSTRDDFLDVRAPYVSMYTSLGCPYYCSFCCINALFMKPGIRYWSIEKVISWIDKLVNNYHVRNIRFSDELFVLSPQRIELFCDLLIDRHYPLNIWAYGRVDTIKEHQLKKMKKAGVNWIALGIESANEKVRKSANKIIKKDIKNVVRLIQDYDINVIGNYMFGLPEDNMETMKETLQFALELNCEFANFFTVMAYPGSALYEEMSIKDGYLPENWCGFSQHSYETQPLPTRYVSAKDVLRFRDEAFYRYFTNPRYLKYVRNRFGEKVEDHIGRMVQIKLSRKLLEDR